MDRMARCMSPARLKVASVCAALCELPQSKTMAECERRHRRDGHRLPTVISQPAPSVDAQPILSSPTASGAILRLWREQAARAPIAPCMTCRISNARRNG